MITNGIAELETNFIKNPQLAGMLMHSIDLNDYTGLLHHRGTFSITSNVFHVLSKPPSSISKISTTVQMLKEKIYCNKKEI